MLLQCSVQCKLVKGCHSVYAIQFNLVMRVKYRKKILIGGMVKNHNLAKAIPDSG
jgi:hypothetical protein